MHGSSSPVCTHAINTGTGLLSHYTFRERLYSWMLIGVRVKHALQCYKLATTLCSILLAIDLVLLILVTYYLTNSTAAVAVMSSDFRFDVIPTSYYAVLTVSY